MREARKKVLILRFSSMGDVVLTSPVIRALYQQANTEVHLLTKSAFGSIFQANPYVSKVWTFDREPDHLFAALRSEQFDEVIDLHANLRSFKVSLALRRPITVFPKYRIARELLVHTGINLMPKNHIVDRFMQAVAHLGVHYDGKGLDYFIPPETTLPQSPVLEAEQYEVFAVGATHFTKRLPTDRIIEICTHRRLPIVLIGGKQEIPTGQAIATACRTQVLDLCGQLSLHQSALCVRNAATVLTHDTGMMHIAAAFSRPIFSFWGSTHPNLGFWPLYPQGVHQNTSLENTNLSCRPCTKFGRSACPKGHFKCMRELDLSPVLQSTQK
jgi:ADP-heptose:LPS heptosyltransferase